MFAELVKSIVPVEPSKLKFVIVVCVPPKLIASSPKVIDEFAKLAFEIAAEPDKIAFTMFDLVFDDALRVLFVNSCEPVNVATVESISNVYLFDAKLVVIHGPTVTIKVSPNDTSSSV